MLVRNLSLWASWFLSTSAWAALCLSLFLGRTTPLTLSRWWLVGLAGILFVSFATRLLFIGVLRRGMGATGTALSAQRRAALTDIPLAVTLPLLVLVYLSDGFNHTLNSHPLLQWTVIFVPIGAAIVIHEAILNRSAPHWANAFSRIPALNPRTILFVQDLLAIALLVGLALLFFWPIFTGRVPIPADLLPYGPPMGRFADKWPAGGSESRRIGHTLAGVSIRPFSTSGLQTAPSYLYGTPTYLRVRPSSQSLPTRNCSSLYTCCLPYFHREQRLLPYLRFTWHWPASACTPFFA